MSGFCFTYSIDTETLSNEEQEKFPELIEEILYQAHFREKLNDRVYLTHRYQSIKDVLMLFDLLKENAPWFLKKADSIHAFEAGSTEDITKLYQSDEG